MKNILLLLLISFVLCVCVIVFFSKKEHFSDERTFTVVSDNINNISYVSFSTVRGEKELVLFDYLFFLNNYKPLECNSLIDHFISPVVPITSDVWNMKKNEMLYQITHPPNSIDWILFKSILKQVCHPNKEITYQEWKMKRNQIKEDLIKRGIYFDETPEHEKELGDKWENSDFRPMFYERDVSMVNRYQQDLKAKNESLLKVDFTKNNVFSSEIIKTYNDTESKPYGWLENKDINIYKDNTIDIFNISKLPLNRLCSRQWFQCYEKTYDPSKL